MKEIMQDHTWLDHFWVNSTNIYFVMTIFVLIMVIQTMSLLTIRTEGMFALLLLFGVPF